MVALALIRLHRLVLLACLAVALTATGFAHRVAGPQDEAMAFVLAMGALPADFCGDGPDGSPSGGSCLACQIAGAADLPPAAAALIDLDLAFVATVVAPRETRAAARVLDPGHSPQGPPTV